MVNQDAEGKKVEYRVWNPFRSKLAASIVGGVENIWMGPGSKVLYLGAASGTTVSHVSDLVGPEGVVYAVEFSHRSGRDLINMAKNRPNVVPIIEDARHPLKCVPCHERRETRRGGGRVLPSMSHASASFVRAFGCRYRMLVGMVDCIFADVAQPDQVRGA